MVYGYNPFRGTEQFYDCVLPQDETAPITYWLRDQTGVNFVDVKMPDGHVIRSLTGETAKIYIERGGCELPS